MAEGGEEVRVVRTWASPYVLRVHLALRLKGISYEVVEEDLKKKNELLLKSNPDHEKVPVLIHNGKPICESSVIVQYIDEAFAGAKTFDPSKLLAGWVERFGQLEQVEAVMPAGCAEADGHSLCRPMRLIVSTNKN